jgi:hypothetical protein
MARAPIDVPRLEVPFAQLERALIDEYIRMRGHDPASLRSRVDPEARALLTDASTYAAARLTEVESRAHYVHEIHAGH